MEREKARILIVDDEPINLQLMVGALKADYEIVTARGGHEAIQKIKECSPDLILLDIMIPDLSGIKVCRVIKADESCTHIPVLFLTALVGTDNEARGLDAGGIDYLTKPLNIDLLKLKVRNQIEQTRRVYHRAAVRQDGISAIHPWDFSEFASTLRTPSGTLLPLTAHECMLLRLLLAAPGTNVGYQEIFDKLGQDNDHFAKARLEVLITRLRTKVTNADPASILPIKSRRNIGYVFLCEPSLVP